MGSTSQLFLIFLLVGIAQSYSKYGRTCKDINCPSNEVCIMEKNECSYYQRDSECAYPTCKMNVNQQKIGCETYVCPPTKKCVLHGDSPKCIDDEGAIRKGYNGYDTKSVNSLYPTLGQTSPPPSPVHGGGVRPGETTPRPNIYRAPSSGGGYQGGKIGSGYPGYPTQQQGGYYGGGQQPQQQQYPAYGGGYYNTPPNRGGYPQQPGYNQYNNRNPYKTQKNNGQSGGVFDSLQNFGTDLLRNALKRINL